MDNIVWKMLGVAACTWLWILLMSSLAERLSLIDHPCDRKRHTSPVPVVGGLSILLSSFVVVVVEPTLNLNYAFFLISVLVGVGVIDDIVNLGVRIRLTIQVSVSLLMIFFSDLMIRSLGLGFWGTSDLPFLVGVFLTIFGSVALSNGINMIDGIDGLSSGVFISALMVLCGLVYFTVGPVSQIEPFILLATAVLAFWVTNMSMTPLNKVFLGDAGSVPLGFVLAWILIYLSQGSDLGISPVEALWSIVFPVCETTTVVLRRLWQKRSPFQPDRIHLHFVLLDSGWSPKAILILIICASVAISLSGILIARMISQSFSLFWFLTVFVLYAYFSVARAPQTSP